MDWEGLRNDKIMLILLKDYAWLKGKRKEKKAKI